MRTFGLTLMILMIAGCCNHDTGMKKSISGDEFWAHHFCQITDIHYGDEDAQILDIFSQGQWVGEPDYWHPDTVNHPTLVYIHGGGWLGGTKDHVSVFTMPYLQRGFNVVLLEYRTGEGTAPDAVTDCMLAFRWIVRHGKEYNIDLNNIYVSGESAGGHLALITGILNSESGSDPLYCGDSLKIKGIINWFGVTDIAGIDAAFRTKEPDADYALKWAGSVAKLDTVVKYYSPVNRITKNTPPVITIHGNADSVVPYEQALKLQEILNKNGVKNELVTIEKGKHLGFSDEGFKTAFSHIFKFIDK